MKKLMRLSKDEEQLIYEFRLAKIGNSFRPNLVGRIIRDEMDNKYVMLFNSVTQTPFYILFTEEWNKIVENVELMKKNLEERERKEKND